MPPLNLERIKQLTPAPASPKNAPLVAPFTQGRPQPDQLGADGALDWCLANFSGGGCPADGRNHWLTSLALFCNERGISQHELLDWALGHSPLADHGEKRIKSTVRGIYERSQAAFGSKVYASASFSQSKVTAPSNSLPEPFRTAVRQEANWLPELIATRERLQVRSEGTVTFAPALYWQDDEPVIWPRTLNLIQGQTGAHKSRVAELFSAVLFANELPVCDTLGIVRQGQPGVEYTLCYVDTERNITDQLPYAIQQMREKAGFGRDFHPATFDYVSLEEVPRAQRLTALGQYLAHVRKTYKGHLVIVLDVLTDCIGSFNDEKESLLLVDMLNRLINTQNLTFLCVIHENPGGVKARGHLGTEAANKASTVLQVGYIKGGNGEPTEVIEMRYLKRRNGRPGLTAHARYDEASRGLVRADPTAVGQALASRRTKGEAAELAAGLAAELALGPLPAGKLEKQLSTRLNTSSRTIRERLAELVATATTVLDVNGRECVLEKTPSGKQTLYALLPFAVAS